MSIKLRKPKQELQKDLRTELLPRKATAHKQRKHSGRRRLWWLQLSWGKCPIQWGYPIQWSASIHWRHFLPARKEYIKLRAVRKLFWSLTRQQLCPNLRIIKNKLPISWVRNRAFPPYKKVKSSVHSDAEVKYCACCLRCCHQQSHKGKLLLSCAKWKTCFLERSKGRNREICPQVHGKLGQMPLFYWQEVP